MNDDLDQVLDELLALPAETEWVEFKEAKSGYQKEDLGKYFSALSNEANLKSRPCAWLLFGVTNKPPRKFVGSQGLGSSTLWGRCFCANWREFSGTQATTQNLNFSNWTGEWA